jgi:hypothetical protein
MLHLNTRVKPKHENMNFKGIYTFQITQLGIYMYLIKSVFLNFSQKLNIVNTYTNCVKSLSLHKRTKYSDRVAQ